MTDRTLPPLAAVQDTRLVLSMELASGQTNQGREFSLVTSGISLFLRVKGYPQEHVDLRPLVEAWVDAIEAEDPPAVSPPARQTRVGSPVDAALKESDLG